MSVPWLFNSLANNLHEGSLAARLRRRRFRLFLELIAPLERPVRVLDIGGTAAFWASVSCEARSDLQIVMLNRRRTTTDLPNLTSIEGNATDLSRFSDREFDAVFSNSVIEHVGDWEAQRAMAEEVVRVGRHYFIQTPNRFFPIEPHFLVPGFQFLPIRLRVELVQRFDLGWYARIPDAIEARDHVSSHRLLSASEMRKLFPNGRLHRERLLGLTKSLIAFD